MSPEADALVDQALETISGAVEAAPAAERSEVLSSIVASLIDSVVAGSQDPTRAGQILCHYIARALSDCGCNCDVEVEGVPAIAAPHIH